jgi:mTERF domain-containing protein, mitochondrial
LVEFPAFFTYGLESTVRPRHEIVVRKGFTCSLAWLLNCSDAKFDERMKYDTIGVEEMEADSSDMNAFVEDVDSEEDGYGDYDSDDEFVR